MGQHLPHHEILPDNLIKLPLLFLCHRGFYWQSSSNEEIYTVHLRKHAISATRKQEHAMQLNHVYNECRATDVSNKHVQLTVSQVRAVLLRSFSALAYMQSGTRYKASGVFKNVKTGCSKFSIIFFTLNISTIFLPPNGGPGASPLPSKYAPRHGTKKNDVV